MIDTSVCVRCGAPGRPGRFSCSTCGGALVSTGGAAEPGMAPAPPPVLRPGDPTIAPEMQARSRRAAVAAGIMGVLVMGVFAAAAVIAVGQFRADAKPKVPEALKAWADGGGQTYATNRFVVRMPDGYEKSTEVLSFGGYSIKMREAGVVVGDTLVFVMKGGMDASLSSTVLNEAEELGTNFASSLSLDGTKLKLASKKTAGHDGYQLTIDAGGQQFTARIFVIGTDLVLMGAVGPEKTNDVVRVLASSYEAL